MTRVSRAGEEREPAAAPAATGPAAVNTLAQQVGVPAVPGVLLDQVHDHSAHLPRFAGDEVLAEVVVTGVHLSRVRHLPTPPSPRRRPKRRGWGRLLGHTWQPIRC